MQAAIKERRQSQNSAVTDQAVEVRELTQRRYT